MKFPLRKSAPPAEASHPATVPIPFPSHAEGGAPGANGAGPSLADRLAPALRSQATGADARAERLIRQVRRDVERLEATLEQLHAAQGDLLQVDAAAAAENPEAAAALPPPVLVRALLETTRENQRLRRQLRKARRQRNRAIEHARALELAAAARDSRLATLEEVIAALHANLQDLRYERELLRPAGPAELTGPGTLPPGRPAP